MALLIIIAVLLSNSRTGIFALSIALLCYILFRFKYFNKKTVALSIIASLAFLIILYLLKKDSANGRLLIWRSTTDLIADSPIIGHGPGAFRAKYMLFQAEYINTHPDSKFLQLADNTLHPFNEYLLVLSEHGLIGLIFLVLMVLLLIYSYRIKRDEKKIPALMSLLSLAIFSFFSYPFSYPFTWVILIFNIVIICDFPIKIKIISSITGILHFPNRWKMIFRGSFRFFMQLMYAGLLIYFIIQTKAEIKWKYIANLMQIEKKIEILNEYDKLNIWLNKNAFFLYNHAAVLHEVNKYEKALKLLSD